MKNKGEKSVRTYEGITKNNRDAAAENDALARIKQLESGMAADPADDWTAGLTRQQAAAFHELRAFALGVTNHSMAVLSGFAGTGKTFLVARLLRSLANEDMHIAVAAPTNKAVRVLRDKMTEEGNVVDDEPVEPGDYQKPLQSDAGAAIAFSSIHSLLGLQLTDLEDGSQECQKKADSKLHKYDLVIVDECSMIGMDLFSGIVAAKRDTRVLFVGDPAQLPPIEAKKAETVSPTFRKITLQSMLSDVVRQAQDNPIIKLSMLLRQAIEDGERIDPLAITMTLPPISENPSAALLRGGRDTIANFAVFEIKEGRDARVIAFTNEAVLDYNARIHHGLYGTTECPYVSGEPVVAQTQCNLLLCTEAGVSTGATIKMITSEEAVLHDIRRETHPWYPEIPAYRVVIALDNGRYGLGYIPADQRAFFANLSGMWSVWKQIKAQALLAQSAGKSQEAARLQIDARHASDRAWSMKKSFSPLRHAYALTAHKSQGSTFDTALVDLHDMAGMRSAFQFNRGLYVAITRPRKYLAIVA